MEQKGQLELAQSRLRIQRRHLVVDDKPPREGRRRHRIDHR